jgi:endonuclease/exonuclease/phosphatase family metal-dependent hydrolase
MSIARRTSPAGSAVVVVATLNVRHTADRWRERAPLLVEQLVALDPDVIGLQEVRRFPDQARWIAREAGRRRPTAPGWDVLAAPKSGARWFWEGLAVLSRPPVTSGARLRLGEQSRVAQRVTVVLADGRALDVYNVHLADGAAELRTAQVRRLLAWMDQRPGLPQVLVGDFNSRPRSAPLQLVTARLRSAYALVHGSEPSRTVHSGGVLDYIFVNDRVVVHDAWVAFDMPSTEDRALLPSDHLGLAAALSLPPAG